MVVYTMTKKQILRIISIVLFALVIILIAVFAVSNAVAASAETGKLPIYCVDRGDNKIAVTFDCAWGNSNTDALLAILKEANATATFFVTGEFCDKYPEDVRKFHDAGHSVQNHSDKHPHVLGMNINDLIEDVRECSRKIEMITGEKPTLYRAPYGEYDDNLITTVEGMGLKVIQWSADSIDWEDPDHITIKKRILEKTESGSILLFHNDLENTEKALPSLLTELKQKGYEFVATEDMIYTENYKIDNTGKQIFEPVILTSGVVVYSDNPYLDSGFEKIRNNLTLTEIYNLSEVTSKIALLPKTRDLLTSAEIYAFQHASYEELLSGYYSLVYAAEKYGAGGALTTPSQTTAPEDTVPETTTTPITSLTTTEPPPVDYDDEQGKK